MHHHHIPSQVEGAVRVPSGGKARVSGAGEASFSLFESSVFVSSAGGSPVCGIVYSGKWQGPLVMADPAAECQGCGPGDKRETVPPTGLAVKWGWR